MIRKETTRQTGQVIADVSQFSMESGRLSAEDQLEKIVIEREILKKRKGEIEKLLYNYKKRWPAGRMIAGRHKTRTELIDENMEIQKRLVEIKPAMKRLHDIVHRSSDVILEEILVVLNRIENKLSKETPHD